MPSAATCRWLVLQLVSPCARWLRTLLRLPARPHQTLAEQVARLGALAAKLREADKTTARLDKARQFNRKVAINGELRWLETEIQRMKAEG